MPAETWAGACPPFAKELSFIPPVVRSPRQTMSSTMKSTLSLFAALVLLGTISGYLPRSPQASAGTSSEPDLAQAVVRLLSHGASATVIETGPGRTTLLSCAHAFEGRERFKPLVVDIPTSQPKGTPQKANPRVTQVDYDLDLSLVILDAGPVEACAPVAPAGHVPSRRLRSVGYDEMRWPATNLPVHILAATTATTFTTERPWHGRSGGGLLDLDHRVLLGVVQGYEVTGQRRGLYVSHEAILTFLGRRQATPRPAPQATPRALPAFPSTPCPPSG
jgi:hypothetical protein